MILPVTDICYDVIKAKQILVQEDAKVGQSLTVIHVFKTIYVYQLL